MPYVPPGVDVFFIPNPNPTRHYRWISAVPKKMRLWTQSYGGRPGYRVECGASVADTLAICEKLGFSADRVNKALNRIEYGDVILASIPIEEYHRRNKERRTNYDEKESAAKEALHAQVDKIPGMTSFEEAPESTADRKRYNTRSDRPFSGQTGTGKSPALRRRTST